MCMSEAAPPATREWVLRLARGARMVLEGEADASSIETVLASLAAAFALLEAGRGRAWLSSLAAEALNGGSYEPLLASLARLYGREAALLIEARLLLERGDRQAARVKLMEALEALEKLVQGPAV